MVMFFCGSINQEPFHYIAAKFLKKWGLNNPSVETKENVKAGILYHINDGQLMPEMKANTLQHLINYLIDEENCDNCLLGKRTEKTRIYYSMSEEAAET